ncbi:FAD-linked sulfhydryl oxidase ERV1 [Zea mays]|uniref:Sulfhydryl oxidase n=1 Tax=Zea mays TaxID=4577 RepID=A0A3L6ED63_MAIZE|nr:FAD-linked sulfhydryl oxidase ERV1 [Zea mays]
MEEVGRATWMLLHTITGSQCSSLTNQQGDKDRMQRSWWVSVRCTWFSMLLMMHIISRLYPCKECADHFKKVLK